MGTIVDKLLGRANTSAAIRAEMTKAEAAAEKAQAALKGARAEYSAALLSDASDAALKARQTVSSAEVAADQTNAIVAEMRRRFEAECEREAETERRTEYENLVKRRKAHMAKLRREYVEHSQAIVALLAEMAAIDAAAAAINADLPRDAAPLRTVEQEVRTLPAIPPTELKREEIADNWYIVTTGDAVPERVPPELEPQIERTGPQTGTLSIPGRAEHGMMVRAPRRVQVARRRRSRVTTRPRIAAVAPEPLATAVRLPGLGPLEPAHLELDPVRRHTSVRPEEILAAVEASRRADRSGAPDRRHVPAEEVREELEPVDPDGRPEVYVASRARAAAGRDGCPRAHGGAVPPDPRAEEPAPRT